MRTLQHSSLIPAIMFGFAFALLVMMSEVSSADVLWLKGRERPVYGQVVKSDEVKIVFRVHPSSLPAGSPARIEDVDRDKIELLIQNIDAEKLALLTPERPDEYRLMAEELSSQQLDLEARDLAIRLYMISIANSVGEDRSSSLIGLVDLARTTNEKIKFETFRFLISDEHVPLPQASAKIKTIQLDKALVGRLLQLVRAIRQGDSGSSSKLIRDPDLVRALARWEKVCSVSELQRFARSNRPPLAALAKLMEIERDLLTIQAKPDTGSRPFVSSRDSTSWAAQASESASSTTALPKIETVSEFDPSRSVWAGQWMTPQQKKATMPPGK